MFLNRAYSTASASTSNNWRTVIKQNQLMSQISSILLQRRNWVPLLQNLNLYSKLTPSLFLQILRGTQSHPQISLDFFNWAKSHLDFKPDLKSECHIIGVYLGSGLCEPVKPILDSLLQTYPASVLSETVIQACRGNDSQAKALSFFLECYSQKGLFLEGLEVFRKMRANGCIPSVCAFNAFLDVLQRENEIKLAWCVYGAMIRDGVMPDKFTWSLVSQILCKDGKFERIVRLLDMGIYNSVMYNAVVDCYSQRGDFGAAFDCLNKMRERKLSPSLSTHSSILDGACKHGNVDVIERVMAEMVEKELLPKCPESDCDSIIQKLCDLRKMNAATMFFKRAWDEKIGLQHASYGCMLRALSKEGRIEEAIDLYRVMLKRSIVVKDSSYHAFADLICNENQSKEGYEILRDMMRRGFSPCSSSLSKFISSLCSNRRWREVEEFFDVFMEKGLLPDSLCCCFLVEHYCSSKQVDKALALHNKMEKLQLSLDVTTYNILLDGLNKEGRVEEAVKLFDYMKGLKLVNSTSFAITIHGLCSAKEMRKAMKLHDEMLKMGLKSDKATYKRLILGFAK